MSAQNLAANSTADAAAHVLPNLAAAAAALHTNSHWPLTVHVPVAYQPQRCSVQWAAYRTTYGGRHR
jgi:hypothetical protein